MSIQAALGIIAGVLELGSFGIYVVSILKGDTKPDRVTWWILALETGTITVTYYISGARDTIWLPIAYTISFTFVALLSLKFGEGTVNLSTLDRVCLTGAIASLLVWWLSGSAVIALYMGIVVDFIGIVPTISKSYLRPWTESKLSWAVAVAASFLNVLAIQEWVLPIYAYPVYLLIFNCLIAFFILVPRKKRPL